MHSTTTVARLTSLFEDAGKAHHEAFASVDGHDPEWAAWYAEFVIGQLTSLIDWDVALEDLAGLLTELEDRRAEASEANWARYYAEGIVLRFTVPPTT